VKAGTDIISHSNPWHVRMDSPSTGYFKCSNTIINVACQHANNFLNITMFKTACKVEMEHQD